MASLLFTVIRVEYEIPEQRNHSVLGKSTGNHRKKRTDAVRNFVVVIRFIPCIIIGIRCENAAHFCIGTIANHGQETVFHQLWNISAIANGNLLPCIMYSGILADGRFEFTDGQRGYR